jgi:hypothetical protein
MIDFFLEAALTGSFANLPETSQSVIIAQAQTALVYLPVTTTQSKTPKCVTFTARNTSSRTVRDPYVNYTDSAGKPFRYSLSPIPSQPISLKAGERVTFNMCEGQFFVNVEAKQQ